PPGRAEALERRGSRRRPRHHPLGIRTPTPAVTGLTPGAWARTEKCAPVAPRGPKSARRVPEVDRLVRIVRVNRRVSFENSRPFFLHQIAPPPTGVGWVGAA